MCVIDLSTAMPQVWQLRDPHYKSPRRLPANHHSLITTAASNEGFSSLGPGGGGRRLPVPPLLHRGGWQLLQDIQSLGAEGKGGSQKAQTCRE